MRNFFQQQQQARKRTTALVVLFTLAVLCTVALTNLVVAVAASGLFNTAVPPQPFFRWWAAHPAFAFWTSLLVLATILLATFYRLATLRSGGGAVALELGGTRVDENIRDPQARMLRNIVEEMAIAAGIPAPAVYVLENESGINAFAAGYGPSDAAVAVTRGTLNALNREELEGVIGHEMSHILNGDMRLNTRLIGVLFGVLAIAVIGRFLLRAASETGGRSAAGIGLLGLALLITGYTGLLFGRAIKAAVSRSREYLADASAVQFSRNPSGIAGALKKIAVQPEAKPLLGVDSEEVGHMLFNNRPAFFSSLFATHPPLEERIRRLEPGFRPNELEKRRYGLEARPATSPNAPPTASPWSPAAVVAAIGAPTAATRATGQAVTHEIPATLRDAAHSPVDAMALVLALTLHQEEPERRRQLQHLREKLSATSYAPVEAMAPPVLGLDLSLRLPLLELALPALRSRPRALLQGLVTLSDNVARLDGHSSVFDYALTRLLRQYVAESLTPPVATTHALKLHNLNPEVQTLFSVLAEAGHRDAGAARLAFDAGVRHLLPNHRPDYAPPTPWFVPLDRALTRLDTLPPLIKQTLIEALVMTVGHDRQVVVAETELLRVICALLHCPLPPLARAA